MRIKVKISFEILRLLCFVILFVLPDALFAQQKQKIFPGAAENTPSRSEYFSWINNTGEGSTEQQTLSNLDFFKWLHDEYGMVLDIYAFDAGNIEKEEYLNSGKTSKFEIQFPHGFGPIAEKAAAMGTRLGVWDAPDRFGSTPQDEKKRIDYMVSLCRDFHFELFKFDAMGGDLRNEKQDAFIRMMTECRMYSPNLILLNHRINLGTEAVKQATTFLLGGDETYIDVHMTNSQTATHHRAGALSREIVPELKRLTEDHGVCLSSCLDYWEDDLILQAFNRNLILAPEIYGNPWLLRDDEFPRLARIFNLARKYKNILVNGILLPEDKYGEKGVSRGDEKTRLITLRNMSWLPVTRTIKLDEEIGLSKGVEIELRQFHPVEKVIGRFKKGQSVNVEVLPFRSCLLMATSEKQQDPTIEGCDYEVVRDVAGKPVQINLLAFPGETKRITYKGPGKTASLNGKLINNLIKGKTVEIAFPGITLKEKYHRKIGDMISVQVPEDAESLYEATCYAADNNALEVRSLQRSGPTMIPQVQKARDAFFGQELFIDRGLWDHYLFDGDMKTSFYPSRRQGRLDFRINGGSLRLDMGEVTRLDSLNIFIGDEFGLQPFKSWEPMSIQVSADLKTWTEIIVLAGKEITISLDHNNPVRYIRFPGTPLRVLEIEGYSNGIKVDRTHWRASDLFSQYMVIAARAAFQSSFVLNEVPKGSYLAVALNGHHGDEGAYAALRVNGVPVGSPDRSLSYRSNAWEYPVRKSESDYTYYFPLTEEMKGAKIDAVVMVMKDGLSEFKPEVWITSYPVPYEKMELVLN
jgi:hypothetical protein